MNSPWWANIFVVSVLSLGTAAEPLAAQNMRALLELRLAKLAELNLAGKCDSAVTNVVLASRYPDDLLPTAATEIDQAIALHLPTNELNAGSLRSFVELNDRSTPALLKYVETYMATCADDSDRLEYLRIARKLGPRAKSLESQVRQGLKAPTVVRIVAASALYSMNQDEGAKEVLLNFLRSGDRGEKWRAADAVGLAQVRGAREELEKLMSHESVRVRVTAARAYWRITKESGPALAMLVEGLKHDHEPLAIGFIVPSNTGDSHHAYVAAALGEMRSQRIDTLDVLLEIVERAAADSEPESRRALVGLSALAAIANSGAVPTAAYDRLQKAVARENSVFEQLASSTRLLMSDIKKK